MALSNHFFEIEHHYSSTFPYLRYAQVLINASPPVDGRKRKHEYVNFQRRPFFYLFKRAWGRMMWTPMTHKRPTQLRAVWFHDSSSHSPRCIGRLIRLARGVDRYDLLHHSFSRYWRGRFSALPAFFAAA